MLYRNYQEYDSKLKKQLFFLKNQQDSLKLAKIIASNLQQGDVLLFKGSVGEGKSFFCRAIIHELCGKNIVVSSPTQTLVQCYSILDYTIFHYDLYRLNHSAEIEELGFNEALSNNICLIEWPEIIETLIPYPYQVINLKMGDNNSRICCIDYIG